MNKERFINRRIAVTGACGTVGRELVRQITEAFAPDEILCIDNNESEMFFLEQHHSKAGNVTFFIADIRDKARMVSLFKGIDVVFHTAAYKHVILCEHSPMEAAQTNIMGTGNIIEAALHCKVGKVIFTSSDKAVNPTNVMGTSKLMGERLITAANSTQRSGKRTVFASTRFGNVLGSRGSVLPIFFRQIAQGGPLTLTDERMTRFIMSIQEAVRLVIDSESLACGGEVFVTKMPVIRILDLAEVMIESLAQRFGYDPSSISIRIIGSKPGEKLYEELMSEEEKARTMELECYFSVIPAFLSMYEQIDYAYPDVAAASLSETYTSKNQIPMTKKELSHFLAENNLLIDQHGANHPDQRYWP